MSHPYLRVYFGPEEKESPVRPGGDLLPRQQVTVPLGEVLPALADATNMRRAWLRDFDDDDVTISTDLYEVLLAYQELRPTG
jgi:hypothetical protein